MPGIVTTQRRVSKLPNAVVRSETQLQVIRATLLAIRPLADLQFVVPNTEIQVILES
jgi:hypothetical protein